MKVLDSLEWRKHARHYANLKENDEAIKMVDIRIISKKGKLLINISNSLLLLFQIIIIILLTVVFIYKIKLRNKEKRKNDIIYNSEELIYDSLNKAAERAKEFIKISSEDKLFNNNTSFKLSKNPKLSVVIPIYNCENTIKRAIFSIKNQNLSDFEIILVNDLSKDNSLNIIEGLQKEDSRIKIINNKNNMGILYSRCVGALAAKGKYIFPLDADDMFLDYDVFYKTVNETAEKYDFDIVEFRFIETKELDNFFKNDISEEKNNKHKLGNIIYQPELSGLALKVDKYIGYYKNDLEIWGKCIKSKLYKKAINHYGENRYSNNVINFEDSIMNYIIFQYADNFILIPKYGILRIKSTSLALHNPQSDINEMRLLDAVVDFSKNNFQAKQIVVNLALKFLHNFHLETTIKNEEDRILLKSILEKIFNCKYISKENKDIIKIKAKNILTN